jgi:hypothetical protein
MTDSDFRYSHLPFGPVVGFTVPIGPAFELREGSGRGGCGGNTSMTTTPLMMPSPLATLYAFLIAFIATRPVRRR